MSINASVSKPKVDRRILRTREQLGDALVELILQKPFDTITVQEVLDRAGICRSTFYVHYRDKNDLFVSDVDEFFELMASLLSRNNDQSDRVAPVREFFAHVAEMRHFYTAMVASGRIHDVLELGQGEFARGIEQRLAHMPRASGIPAEQRAAVAHAHAGALLSLMSWWLDHNMPSSPERMDELFHRMLWTGISSSSDQQGQVPRTSALFREVQ
jgi:AcrR family transcriptional regulator